MYEPFGPRFYEWWAGLSPGWRYGIGGAVVAAAAVLWWLGIADVWFCGPLAAVGGVLLAFAGGKHECRKELLG